MAPNHNITRKRTTHTTRLTPQHTARYTPHDKTIIRNAHRLLRTSAKNYSSIGRKVSAFMPPSHRTEHSHCRAGKQVARLLWAVRRGQHKQRELSNQHGGGHSQQQRTQQQRAQCIQVLRQTETFYFR